MRVTSASSAGEPQSEQNRLPGAMYEPQLEQCILVGVSELSHQAISLPPGNSCLSGDRRFATQQNRRGEQLRLRYP